RSLLLFGGGGVDRLDKLFSYAPAPLVVAAALMLKTSNRPEKRLMRRSTQRVLEEVVILEEA
ncbi:unnamed protein product, partial [Brassica rapa subsp. trilocularis]